MGVSKAEITLEIDDDGNIRLEVSGVKGKDCEALTADLEAALGVVSERKRTHEYYVPEENRLKIQLGDG